MRHRTAGRHLGRDTAHRTHMYRNLVTDLLRYERITTTEAKAKEIRPMAEKIITLGKRGDLHARRQAAAFLYDTKVVKKVFDELGPRMRERPGGYLRITALEARKGDGAKMAAIEMVDLNGLVAMPRPQRVTAAPTSTPRAAAAAAALAPAETGAAEQDAGLADAGPEPPEGVPEVQPADAITGQSATAEAAPETPVDEAPAEDAPAAGEAPAEGHPARAEGDGA